MLDRWFTGRDLAIGLAAFLLAWYFFGVQVNRRRAGRIVRQIRDSLQPLGGTATIRWIGGSAFRIEAEQLAAPFVRLGVSGLLEPRETFFLWLFGRLSGRRDWLVMGVTLGGSVGRSFEVYHPRRRGAAEVIRDLRAKGWQEEPMVGRPGMLCAAPDADGRALAREVLSVIGPTDVWRVGLRPEAPHLTVSFPVPASESRVPLPIFAALPHIARTILSRGRGA